MLTFLFDIAPEAGHIRFTLNLATSLYKRGYEVRYTDTSDSAFTFGLIQKGIGRVVYPSDLRWFTPDLVLLDHKLNAKALFYRQLYINYIYVTAHFPGNQPEKENGTPFLYLPLSEQTIAPSSDRLVCLSEKLPEIKKDFSRIVIASLLQDDNESETLYRFYEKIKTLCITHSEYEFILLVKRSRIVQQLFPLPENLSLYRLLNLRTLLPGCDLVLTSGELDTLSECIRSGTPMLIFPARQQEEQLQNGKQVVLFGLGDHIREESTPEELNLQIKQLLQQKKEIKNKAQELHRIFTEKNLKLEQLIDELTQYTIKNKI